MDASTLFPVPTGEVGRMLVEARAALAVAVDEVEAADAVEELLEHWYDAWPATAVTSPHYPIAVELVRLLGSGRRPRWWRGQHRRPGVLARLLRASAREAADWRWWS